MSGCGAPSKSLNNIPLHHLSEAVLPGSLLTWQVVMVVASVKVRYRRLFDKDSTLQSGPGWNCQYLHLVYRNSEPQNNKSLPARGNFDSQKKSAWCIRRLTNFG